MPRNEMDEILDEAVKRSHHFTYSICFCLDQISSGGQTHATILPTLVAMILDEMLDALDWASSILANLSKYGYIIDVCRHFALFSNFHLAYHL